jgi:hypothetical protein
MLAGWVTKDQSLTLGVSRESIPRGMPLIQKSLEEGFRKTMNGTITESSAENTRGYTVFKMSARGSIAGKDSSATQFIVAIDDGVYTVIAMSFGKDVNASDDARAFLASFRILRESTGPAAATKPVHLAAKGGDDRPQTSLVDQLSQRIGGISVLLLLLCIVILLTTRMSRRAKALRDTGPGGTESTGKDRPDETGNT